MLLGAVGTPTRLDFTAIGDTVNAALVEGENKRFGSCILITSETCAAVPLEERTRLGIAEQAVTTTIKGKQAPLQAHIVNHEQSTGLPINRVVPHDKKLAVFVRGRWPCLLRYWRWCHCSVSTSSPQPVAMVLTLHGPLTFRRMDLLRPGDEVLVPPLGGVQILFLRDGTRRR